MSVYHYLKDFKADLNSSKYIQRLVHEDAPVEIFPLSNKTIIHKYFGTVLCKLNPYACASKLKMDQYKLKFSMLIRFFMLPIENFLQP